MSTVTQPRVGIPIASVNVNGRVFECVTNSEFVRFFESLMGRVGGPTGAGTPDLEIAQFDDAGIEETKHTIYQLSDAVGQAPAHQAPQPAEPHPEGIYALLAEMDALRARVAALEQGVSA